MERVLQCSLLDGQCGDSAKVFPDFDELRGVVLVSLWWVFQLEWRNTRSEFGRVGSRGGGRVSILKSHGVGPRVLSMGKAWGGFYKPPQSWGMYQASRHLKESHKD